MARSIPGAKEFQAAVAKIKKPGYARFLIKRQGRTIYLMMEVPK